MFQVNLDQLISLRFSISYSRREILRGKQYMILQAGYPPAPNSCH